MSPLNWSLLTGALGFSTLLLHLICKRQLRERAAFEAKLSRLFNEVRSDSATRHRFDRMIPKDPPKL